MTNEDRAVLRAQLAATRRLIEKAKAASTNEVMGTYLDLALESIDDVTSNSRTVTRGSRRKNNGASTLATEPAPASDPTPEPAAPPAAAPGEPAPLLVAP